MKYSILVLVLFLSGCAGLKVVNPNEQNNDKGTLALDLKTGKLVGTYTCKLGKKYSALGKSEDEARTEVVARCKDGTVVSFCDEKKVTCSKN